MRKVLAVGLVAVVAGQQFQPYPVGLMHQSRILEQFEESEALLKSDCETACSSNSDCDGFLLIDGFCRQLIERPMQGGLAHHGETDGLYRTDSYLVYHLFRKTNDANFLDAQGIHDCRKDPCSSDNTIANSCIVYGECICKSNPFNPNQDTFIGATCKDPASECTSVLEELDHSAACPCGSRLETDLVDFDAEDTQTDVCVVQSAQETLSPIVTLAECASKYAVTAKLERSNLISPVFRRMGAGTVCIAPQGQDPLPENQYHMPSAEACMQEASGSLGFQFTPTADPQVKNCVVFPTLVDVGYGTDATTACYLDSFFEYSSGGTVKVQTHEKTIDITSRVTSCLVSQQVTTGVNSLQLALTRLGAVRTVAKSFGYKASDGILVMQNQRLKNRLEDQLRFMDLTFQDDSDFFCKTLCPCGTYSISPADTTCTNTHETFRSGLEHVRAQMNCVFRNDWNASDPLSVSVLLNAMSCAALYRDKDDSFYGGVLAEGRARAAYVLSKAKTSSPLHQLLPGTFVNGMKVLTKSITSPISKTALSASGAEALLNDVQALETSTKAALDELQASLVTDIDGKVKPSFLANATTFDEYSMSILGGLTDVRPSSSELLSSLSTEVESLSEILSGDIFTKTRDEFKQDLASFIDRFPGLSPKFDKEIERANAAFDVFSDLMELIPLLFREAVRVASQGNLALSEVSPLKPGQSDLARFQQAIVQFKVLSLREASLDPLVSAMVKFHDDWYALFMRNDGQVLDLDSTTSYGRFRELMLSIASTATANAYALIYMIHVLDTKHADQDPVWTLSSSGTELLDGLLLRFSSLFVYDLSICPHPVEETNNSNSDRRALMQQRRFVTDGDSAEQAAYNLREAMRTKTSETLNSCAKFHHVLVKLVSQLSLVLGSAFDLVSTAQNELWQKQDLVASSSLAYFVSQVESFPESLRNPFMALFFRERFFQVQARWSKHMESLCNAFKSSSVDLIPSLSVGRTFLINPNLCSVSDDRGLSKAIAASFFIMTWGTEDILTHGPVVCTLNSDGTVTGLYNGTGRVGDMSTVAGLLENVIEIRAGLEAFAALRADGRVIAWGNPMFGGDVSSIKELESGVERLLDTKDLAPTESAIFSLLQGDDRAFFFFGAQKRDGSIVIWGGAGEPRVFQNVAKVKAGLLSGAIIHTDRTVSVWGRPACGGDASSVQDLLFDVEEVYINEYQPDNKTVINTNTMESDELLVAICGELQPNFWARKRDGSVVTWGPSDKPGTRTPEAKALLSQGIEEIHLKVDSAFFVRRDKTGFTLGPKVSPLTYETNKAGNFSVAVSYGPNGADSSSVAAELRDIQDVVGEPRSYAVRRSDGSVVVWGAMEGVGAGNASSVADFLQRDVEEIVGGESTFFPGNESYCAIKRDGSIKCWGVTANSRWKFSFEEAEETIQEHGGVQRDAMGNAEIFSLASNYLVRTRRGMFVRWGFYTFQGNDEHVTRAPDVGIRQVSLDHELALMEDGSVVSFDPNSERRLQFETLLQPKLKDIVRMVKTGFWGGQVIVFEAADGSLSAWATRDQNIVAAFDGLSTGSEIEASNRLVAKVRDTGNGLTSATNRWLRPVHAKQQSPVSVQPSCAIKSAPIISPLLLQRVPQVIDVSIASFPQFCDGNLGVTKIDMQLYDADGQQIQDSLPLRFKIRPAPGAFEAKYFSTPSGEFLEVLSQRTGEDAAVEYVVDLAAGSSTERSTLASSGDVLPSPYTKWILSLESSWPQDLSLAKSISLSFTLAGGVCSSDPIDISAVKFAGERGFLTQDGVASLSVATTCGGATLFVEEPVVETLAPTSQTGAPTPSSGPSNGAEEKSESPSWVLPAAVSGGAVACLVVALAVFLLRRRKAAVSEDTSEDLITANL